MQKVLTESLISRNFSKCTFDILRVLGFRGPKKFYHRTFGKTNRICMLKRKALTFTWDMIWSQKSHHIALAKLAYQHNGLHTPMTTKGVFTFLLCLARPLFHKRGQEIKRKWTELWGHSQTMWTLRGEGGCKVSLSEHEPYSEKWST